MEPEFFSTDSINRRRKLFQLEIRNSESLLKSRLTAAVSEVVQFLQSLSHLNGSNPHSRSPVVSPFSSSVNDLDDNGAATTPPANSDTIGPLIEEFLRGKLLHATDTTFQQLAERVPTVEPTETWEREELLRRVAMLREHVHLLKLEIERQRESFHFLSTKYSKLVSFTSNVKSTIWLTISNMVAELEASGQSVQAASFLNRFSEDWPDPSTEHDSLLDQSKQYQQSISQTLKHTSEETDAVVREMINREVDIVRQEGILQRKALEANIKELEESIPLRIAEGIRNTQEKSLHEARLFQQLKGEYELRIDELNDIVECMKLEVAKRADDAAAVLRKLQIPGDLNGFRLETELASSIARQEQSKVDILRLKMESKAESHTLNRSLRLLNQRLSRVRPEEVIRNEAAEPLLLQIHELQSAQTILREKFETAVRENARSVEISKQKSEELTHIVQNSQRQLESARKENVTLISTVERLEAVSAKLQQKVASARSEILDLRNANEKQLAQLRDRRRSAAPSSNTEGELKGENSFVSFSNFSPTRKRGSQAVKGILVDKRQSLAQEDVESTVAVETSQPSLPDAGSQRQRQRPSMFVSFSPRKRSEAHSFAPSQRKSINQVSFDPKLSHDLSQSYNKSSKEDLTNEEAASPRMPSAEECLSPVILPGDVIEPPVAHVVKTTLDLLEESAALMQKKKSSAGSDGKIGLSLNGSALRGPNAMQTLRSPQPPPKSSNSLDLVKMLMEVAALHCAITRTSGHQSSGLTVQGVNSPSSSTTRHAATQTVHMRHPPTSTYQDTTERQFVQACSTCCLCNRHHVEAQAAGWILHNLPTPSVLLSQPKSKLPRRPVSGHVRSSPSVPLQRRVVSSELCLVPERLFSDATKRPTI